MPTTTSEPSFTAVEVLFIDWKPGMDSAKVVGTREGDIANRPVTFHLRPVDAVRLVDQLSHLPQNTTELLVLEVPTSYIVPIIRRGTNEPESVPGPTAT